MTSLEYISSLGCCFTYAHARATGLTSSAHGALFSDYHKNEAGYNLALWKPTKQSTTLRRYASYNAVDGNSSTSLENGHCSATMRFPDSWWQVDLEHVYEIREVVITNSLNVDGKSGPKYPPTSWGGRCL